MNSSKERDHTTVYLKSKLIVAYNMGATHMARSSGGTRLQRKPKQACTWVPHARRKTARTRGEVPVAPGVPGRLRLLAVVGLPDLNQ